jgi:hypothetical protein
VRRFIRVLADGEDQIFTDARKAAGGRWAQRLFGDEQRRTGVGALARFVD